MPGYARKALLDPRSAWATEVASGVSHTVPASGIRSRSSTLSGRPTSKLKASRPPIPTALEHGVLRRAYAGALRALRCRHVDLAASSNRGARPRWRQSWRQCRPL